jgi:phosphomethylpyrimidine synthase
MIQVAEGEGLAAEVLQERVAGGTVVIPCNPNHEGLRPCGIGQGLRTKVNANLGTSTDYPHPDPELEKLQVALEAGADTVMDLSTGGDIDAVRRAILSRCPVPVGTVPIYQAAIEAIEERGAIVDMEPESLFAIIERQAQDGVDFMTVHCGVTRASLERLKRQGRVVDIVSRGGAFLTGWILHNDRENPLYEDYDRLLDIARRYDVTLSLGDGLRPGCLADATDRAQVEELLTLGELVDRARQAGVQVMVEGPGHVPLDQIAANIQLQKRLCREAPFYVLGPLVTDVAAGHDHITAAIGGAIAAMAGADYLCYVTPAEHLGLPELEDVREGIIATRIAGHAADIVKGVKGAWEWDLQMSQARKALDWEAQARLSLDPRRAQQVRSRRGSLSEACSMCGKYCAMDLVSKHLGITAVKC